MDCTIFCTSCRKKFIVDLRNTRIVGPHIEITCPLCKHFTDRNFSKFVEIQIDELLDVDILAPGGGKIKKAVLMQRFSQMLENLVVEGYDNKSK